MHIPEDLARFAASRNPAPPAKLGQRYDAERFLPEAGNTVVCHLDTGDPAHQAVIDARRRLASLPGAENFLFTPESSLHMTVFEGALDTRRTRDAWPDFLPLDASMDDVTDALIPRLARAAPAPQFAVRIEALRPTGLVLAGASDADEARLRAYRDTLTAPFGYRQRVHDSYGFHMTFAYPTGWLPDALLPLWAGELEAIRADLVASTLRLPLRPPAFCRFADMTRFEELLPL